MRGLLSAAVASAALLALPAIAGAAPAGGAAQAVTGDPDVVSSAITSNPLLTSNICYDTEIQAPSGAVMPVGGGGTWTDAASLSRFHLRGYASPAAGLAGAFTAFPFGDVDLNANNPIAAKIDLNNDHCVLLQWPLTATQHLDDWTITEADSGAVQDRSFRNSNPGSAALDGSAIVQRAGLITGLNLVNYSIDPNTNRITYVFDRYVNPVVALSAGLFGFYTQDGTLVTGAAAAAAGRTVTVQFLDPSAGGASVADAVKVGDLFGALSLVTGKLGSLAGIDTINVAGTPGTDRPNIDKATPVGGLGGTYVVHYDKAVALPIIGLPLSIFGVTENPPGRTGCAAPAGHRHRGPS